MPLSNLKTFLVVDGDVDGRTLLVRTLMRVHPECAVTEVQDFETALKLVTSNQYTAVICHRAIGADPQTLVREFRNADANVPILAVSGIDRTQELLTAGANRFLNFDEWLRVGTVVAEMLGDRCPA